MLKSKKQWSLCKFTFKTLNKVAVISNFLAFFQFLVDKFTLLDPDPGEKMNADPCGSGSTALSLTKFEKKTCVEFSIVVKNIKYCKPKAVNKIRHRRKIEYHVTAVAFTDLREIAHLCGLGG